MANRRMFSKDVTNSDEFLDMPLSSQALYFHLGLNADDDGFVSPRGIMRLVEAKEDDLKVLEAKGFIIKFEKSVIVITHWKTNNEIKKDRYKKTIYQEHLEILGLNNGKYTLEPKCLQNVSKMDTQDRLGKDRLGKDRLGKDRLEEINICEATSQEKPKNEINLIFDLFYNSINPMISYNNLTNRKDCNFLIKKFGFEVIKQIVEYAISIQGQEFAPTISTPSQLKNKWVELSNFSKKKTKTRGIDLNNF